ncbi:MAG: Ig-like domain-containing protein [Gemmatimonadota bacterium]|nr:Ig-like domain-containing protein [Gemmatimonadota bacterium]
MSRSCYRGRFLPLTLAGAVGISGCSGELPVEPPGAAVEVIVTPSAASLDAIGDTVQLVARAYDQQGNLVGGETFGWTSTSASVATVSQTGFVVAARNGTAVVMASLRSGVKGGAEVTVLQRIARVDVSPGSVLLRSLGDTLRLRASVVDRLSVALVGEPVAWESSDSSVATVSADGLLTSVNNGNVTVTATASGVIASVDVTVAQVPRGLAVSPEFVVLQSVGSAAQLTASLVDSLGSPISAEVAQWASADPGIAGVSAAGEVVAAAEGVTRVVATAGNFTGVVAISVFPPNDWGAVEEWSTYQGNPAHTGYVPVTLDVADFSEAWISAVAGTAALSPVVTDGDAVALTTTSYLGETVVAVVSATTGTVRWTRPLVEVGRLRPPAARAGSIFLSKEWYGTSTLMALSVTDGTPGFVTNYEDSWLRYHAPVVTADAIYLAGRENWEDVIRRFDLATGELQWTTVPHAGSEGWEFWTPAVAAGRVYTYSGSYGTGAIVMDAVSGDVLDQIGDPASSVFGSLTPVVTDGGRLVVAGEGQLVAFDPVGAAIAWRYSGNFSETPSAARGTVFVARDNDVEARSELDGSILWTWSPPDGEVLTGPRVVTRNLLFAGTNAGTYAIHLGSHEAVWSTGRTGLLALGSNGLLFIAGKNGLLTGIRVR